MTVLAKNILYIWEQGIILKSGTGTGTQIQNFRDLGSRPGLKIEKSGIGDWDRDSNLRDEGFRDSNFGDCPGSTEFRDSFPWTENFRGHSPGPVPTIVWDCDSNLLSKFF